MRTKVLLPSCVYAILICCLQPSKSGKASSPRASCSDLFAHHGINRSGDYEIDVDGDGPLEPFYVHCDMGQGKDPYQVWTLVHHDSETPTNVRGFESPGSYVQQVSYHNATAQHLIKLIDSSYSCQQYVKWACKGAVFGFWFPAGVSSWWTGRQDQPQFYWGGAETDSRTCGCHPYCYATIFNSTCNCDADQKLAWMEDSGLLLDTRRLPVVSLRFGDTGEMNEAGHHTLGALLCRAKGHKDIFMGSFTAPLAFESPNFPEFFPGPFQRFTWHVLVRAHQAMELVFPEYDVLHWGAYNAVPNCKSAVTVTATHAATEGKTVVISRQRSNPPYFISDGTEMEVNVTFTTCNQDKRLPTERGFKAEFRRVECVGCEAGTGDNGQTTSCSGPCGVIASYGYPFPHHWYTNEPQKYVHTWVLEVPAFHVVELRFNDLEFTAIPGVNYCTPDGGVLKIFDGSSQEPEASLGQFCNLNKQGVVYSNQEAMTLVFETKFQRVGNGKGFHATFRAIPVTNIPRPADFRGLPNVAKGRLTRQSSTRDRRAAQLAVDGFLDVTSCSATIFEKEPWWQVDLQKQHRIYAVEIHNKPSGNKRGQRQRQVRWPHGQYGLAKPMSGCPTAEGFRWKTGRRVHDMTYELVLDDNIKHWSDGMLLKGGLLRSGSVEQHFCIKTVDANISIPGNIFTGAESTQWMQGEYCILQVGDTCPPPFQSGYVMWVDKQSSKGSTTRNTAEGTLPKGVYTAHNTTIFFCCRDDGRSDIPIRLPNNKPFFLFQFGKSCQKVEGMSERQQFFHFSEDLPSDSPSAAEDLIPESVKLRYPHPHIDVTLFERGLTLYYCYYDIMHSLRGFRVLVDDSGLESGVGKFYDNFHYGIEHTARKSFLEAYTCVHYSITSPEFSVLRINCTQPIYGQYLTLQIFDRYDSLQLCEIKVFAEEACGQPLGMASEEIFDLQLQASSSDNTTNHYFTDSRLNVNEGWCASPNDKQKFLQVDLLSPTRVTGLVLQGLSHALRNAYVRTFQLTFSNDSKAWFWEEEPIGQQKIYICHQCDHTSQANELSVRYSLLHGFTTRYIKLHIMTFNESPCLRMEIIGCRGKETCGQNLTAPEGVVSSPNHPYYYGQDKACWWTITPPPGQHVWIKFVVYDIAPKEAYRKSCRDELTLYSGFGDIMVRSPDGIYFPQLIISDGPMKLHLTTCFRYSLSRYRGFYATYKFVGCPGCGIGDFQCSSMHVCDSPCGQIVSIGYPLPYQSNHRCRWLIQASPSHFINVTFHDFDIVGGDNCFYDYIDFYDGDVISKDNLIGRFCNARHPPRHLVSSWNVLLVEFSSDAEGTGRGFSLTYKAQKFQLPPELGDLDFDDPAACPHPWMYYHDHCYYAYQEAETLQWSEAESKCMQVGKGRDGHLVSILNEKEMDVVHYLLTAVWRMHKQSLYIGLKDAQLEGIYRWSDSNPMSYTDWAQAGKGLPSQPDGGTFQDCTMLRVDSGHSTAQWHDIPCSLGKHSLMMNGVSWGDEPQHGAVAGGTVATVNSFICKMESERKVGDFEVKPLHLEVVVPKSVPYSRTRYFMCHNQELISALYLCDGMTNCKDRSDEASCHESPCPSSSFRCANGRCVSLAVYCDFNDDCGDRSDEALCDHRVCTSGEFSCHNSQCIPSEWRCNLKIDCQDKSDEDGCGGNCNMNTTFQCFDGTCIPHYAPCDGRRDCPGKYHEDEPAGCYREEDRLGLDEETNSCANLARKTCHDLWLQDGIRTSGNYLVDPDEEEGPMMPFHVWCTMEEKLEDVRSVVHHDSEHRIYVRAGSEDTARQFRLPPGTDPFPQPLTTYVLLASGSGTYLRRIVYDTGLEEMLALISMSERCQQFVKWECMGTGFAFASEKPISWWVDRDGRPQFTWGGAAENLTCACYPNCLRTKAACNCDVVRRFQWAEDSGFIRNKSQLPVQEVWFGNTFKAGQAGYHTVGPLECSGRVPSPSDKCTYDTEYLRCQSGHYISMKMRCLYEFDQFGFEQGCRDVTHLRDCEEFDCPRNYVKCPDAYCIPTRYLCDGKWDCVEGADEQDCGNYMCPGHYRCHNHTMCLPLHELCDGVNHCPHRDDEVLCDSLRPVASDEEDNTMEAVCPAICHCLGYYVDCRKIDAQLLPEPLPKRMRKLDFSRNRLDLASSKFSTFFWLAELILCQNQLQSLPPGSFFGLRNLITLDLRDNRISVIEKDAFKGLNNLRHLNLDNNVGLSTIEPGAFIGLNRLPVLNLTGASITHIRKNTFLGLDGIKTLVLRNDRIEHVDGGAFVGLPELKVLDIQGNEISTFSFSMFDGLSSITDLYSDSFKFCCLVTKQLAFDHCSPPADEISDCEDLMGSPFQRAVIWVLGVIALLGNLFVIVWRIKVTDTNPVSSTLILSLGCADFLMGIYLIIIASVDEHYRGRYMQISDTWRRSELCKFCGVLSTVSSEVSVFTLVFITVDRLVCIALPFSRRHLTLPVTYKLIVGSWLLAVLMACIPFIFQGYFRGEFYARSGVCLALHITNKKPAGWQYSVAIFFCVNLVAFIIIVSAYCYMYLTVRQSYLSVNRMKAHRILEGRIAQQMAIIVMTNFLCWCPIIVMGLMAMSGLRVPGGAYAWTAVFVLPLNSATNPLVYTISTLHCRTVLDRFRLSGSTWQSWQNSMKMSSTSIIGRDGGHQSPGVWRRRESLADHAYRPPHGYLPVLQYIRTCPSLTAKHLLHITAAVCERLKEMHQDDFVFGGLSADTVFVSTDESQRRHVYIADFYVHKASASLHSTDTASDMEDLGLLVKRMLRTYHVALRTSDRIQVDSDTF